MRSSPLYHLLKSNAPPVFLQICVHVSLLLRSGRASGLFHARSTGACRYSVPYFLFFSFNQRFVQEFLGFECPCRGNISLKHKAPDTCWQHTDVFAVRYAFREVIDMPRPNLHSLVCYSSKAFDWLGKGGVLHNYQLSPILQRWQRRWKHNG